MLRGSFGAMSPEDRRTRLVESSIADSGKLARHQYRGTRRALVIDRNPVVQASLEHILAQEGYEVEAPQDGASISYRPDPVLCLVGARDESGLHVFTAPDPGRRERALEATSRLQVYATSEGAFEEVPVLYFWPHGSAPRCTIVEGAGRELEVGDPDTGECRIEELRP
jgi:hypothetical protein